MRRVIRQRNERLGNQLAAEHEARRQLDQTLTVRVRDGEGRQDGPMKRTTGQNRRQHTTCTSSRRTLLTYIHQTIRPNMTHAGQGRRAHGARGHHPQRRHDPPRLRHAQTARAPLWRSLDFELAAVSSLAPATEPGAAAAAVSSRRSEPADEWRSGVRRGDESDVVRISLKFYVF